MLNLARWCSAHRRLVVVGWVVVLVFALGLSGAVGTNYANSFSLPGPTPSGPPTCSRATSPPRPATPTRSSSTRPRRADRARGAAPEVAADAGEGRAAAPRALPSSAPIRPAPHAISRDGPIGFATVNFDERANVLPVPRSNG